MIETTMVAAEEESGQSVTRTVMRAVLMSIEPPETVTHPAATNQ